MTNMKPTMIHSDRGSVFSVFSEEELKNMTNNSKRKVAICGRINNSGIVEVPEGATLAEIIELAGGILDKRDFKLVCGGTDNHLLLLDFTNKNITGKEAEKLLDEAYITVNKNAIPNDPHGANVTSGIRIGTPAVTTRGMVEEDMEVIAEAIDLCLTHKNQDKARELVIGLTKKYPLYEEYNLMD